MPEQMISAMLLVNHPDNGRFTGRIKGLEWGDEDENELVCLDDKGMEFKWLPDKRMRIGKMDVRFASVKHGVGNWCWDEVVITKAALAAILNCLHVLSTWGFAICRKCNKSFPLKKLAHEIEPAETSPKKKPKCPSCGSMELWKWGKKEGVQAYRCKDCKKTFLDGSTSKEPEETPKRKYARRAPAAKEHEVEKANTKEAPGIDRYKRACGYETNDDLLRQAIETQHRYAAIARESFKAIEVLMQGVSTEFIIASMAELRDLRAKVRDQEHELTRLRENKNAAVP